MKKSVRDVEVTGKRVLVRVDFNVPLKNGEVADDSRIRAALPTIRHLLNEGAQVILCSHLGRPGGRVVDDLRMDPVAKRLAEILDAKVRKTSDCILPEVKESLERLDPGEVALLENTRFHEGETANEPEFAGLLAGTADLFVNDAFGASHRAHASTAGVAEFIPGVAGLLLEKELHALGEVRDRPEHPMVAVLGGAKISDKLSAVRHFLTESAEAVLVGGGLANTLLKARGVDVADSLVDDKGMEDAREILDGQPSGLVLPSEVVVRPSGSDDGEAKAVKPDAIPAGHWIGDIGPAAAQAFAERIADARTVVWNGPVGKFEDPAFREGTEAVARAVADLDGTTVVGGGDTVAALHELGLSDRITHISTGGGAFLAFMGRETLPGVEALQDA